MSMWATRASAAVLMTVLLQGAASAVPRDAPVVGEAERVVSEVRGIFGTDIRELVVQDNVYSQEVIATGLEAATRLIFLDRTELSMGPLSQVTLDRYIYDPNATTGEFVMTFVSGMFAWASGLIPAGGYELRTPFANLGIRGTRFQLFLDPRFMQIAVTEGVVTTADGAYLLDNPSLCLVWTELGQPPVFRLLEDCQELLLEVARMIALLLLPDIEPAAGPGPSPPRPQFLDFRDWPATPFEGNVPPSRQ